MVVCDIIAKHLWYFNFLTYFYQDDLCSGELLNRTMKEKDLHVQ